MENSQRVGPLVVIPSLLRELGAEPSEVLANAGLDMAALNDVDNWIPFVTVGKLLRECGVRTECGHFALLIGQRTSLSPLGLPGEMARYSATLGAAIQAFIVYQHLNSQACNVMREFLRFSLGA